MTPESASGASSPLAAVVQAVPSAGAVAIGVLDLSPERWLTFSGIAFIVLQAAYLVWKWHREASPP